MARPADAQITQWTLGGGAGTGDFYDQNNWSLGTVPGSGNATIIDGGGTAIIDAAGTGAGAELIALMAGFAAGGSGTYQMDSGLLTLSGSGATTTLGRLNGTEGKLIMNGGTIHVGNIAGLSGSQPALPSVGFVISNVDGSTGILEMHNDAVFRSVSGIDLGTSNTEGPLGSGATSTSSLIMDGNSVMALAGGIGTRGHMTLSLSDNAELTLGNSSAAGDPNGVYAEGSGHINFGSRYGSTADILIEDNAKINMSRLMNQKGTSTITIRDHGELNIFNTSTGGTETDFHMQNYLSRQVSSSDGTSSTIVTLEGFAKFTIDNDPATVSSDGTDPGGHVDLYPQAGLIIAGGDDEPIKFDGPDANNTPGGYAVLDIKENAELSITRELWMTYGHRNTASSTLKVTGPDATISIGGDLNMAIAIDQQIQGVGEDPIVLFGDPLLVNRPGEAILHSVITGSSHSTIEVGNLARIGNGELAVELSGYSPVLGDSYTLLHTGNTSGVDGEFKLVDLSLAPLSNGLAWDLTYNPDSVVLAVVAAFSAADFDENGYVDGLDLATWQTNYGQTGTSKLFGDADGDMDVDGADFLIWQREFTGSAPAANGAVPEPSSLLLALVAATFGLVRRKRSA